MGASGAERSASDSETIVESLSRPEAFAAIFDRYHDTVHRYLARRVGRELADDLASQTFTAAFGGRAGFRGEADSAAPWLFGIATNLMRSHRRAELRILEKTARFAATRAEGFATGAAPRPCDPAEVDGKLAHALESLDADQRDVLLLFAWAELTYEEIAGSLGVPIGTVRSRLARARSQLRSELADPTAANTRET